MAYYDTPQDWPIGNVYDDPTATGGPTGIPDPTNPGYDTGGFPLSTGAPGPVPQQGFLAGDNYDAQIAHAPFPTIDRVTDEGYVPPPDDGGTGGGGLVSPASAPGFFPTYNLPSAYHFDPFSYESYTPLTEEQAAAEPGYAFARDQGRGAIETSAAARGNVLSGAQLKDLYAWGDRFAGQNYQNAEARNEGIYNLKRGNAFNNWAANQTGGLMSWQANNQPAQFKASLESGNAGLTLADLLGRFNTTTNALTNIATAGSQ